MGKIKHSNKPFEGTKKAFWNKGITKNKKTKKHSLHKEKRF